MTDLPKEKFENTKFLRYRKIGEIVWQLISVPTSASRHRLGAMTVAIEKKWKNMGYNVLISPQASDKNLMYVIKARRFPQTFYLKIKDGKPTIRERYPGYLFGVK